MTAKHKNKKKIQCKISNNKISSSTSCNSCYKCQAKNTTFSSSTAPTVSDDDSSSGVTLKVLIRQPPSAPTASAATTSTTTPNGNGISTGMILTIGVVILGVIFPWSSVIITTARSRTASLQDINYLAYHEEMLKSSNPTKTFLSSFICKHTKGYCHPSMVPIPERRTHAINNKKGEAIPPDTVLLIVPRDRLLLDIDAVRDEWIQRHLFIPAQQKRMQEYPNNIITIDLGAYLAVYVVRRMRQQRQHQVSSSSSSSSTMFDPMAPYFDILPSYEQLRQRHPSLWSNQLQIQLLNQTSALQIAKAIRNMIESEYNFFQNIFSTTATTAADFAQHVPKNDYIAARINVLARSFGTGPISNVEENNKDIDVSDESNNEWTKYCCRALAPILDMWDHHPQAPTQWEYSKQHQAFVVKTKKVTTLGWIPTGSDIWVSYGTYTDSHLFAKFGFVNADGSGWTEASIAAFHDVENVGLIGSSFSSASSLLGQLEEEEEIKTSMQMNQYLQYKYDIYPPPQHYTTTSPSEYSYFTTSKNNITNLSSSHLFQHYKLQLLMHIRNDYHRWNFQMKPRDSLALPGKSSWMVQLNSIPIFLGNNVQFDGKHIISTCRLIALSEEDYGGRALETLEHYYYLLVNKNKNNDGSASKEFVVHPQDEHLEYRALSCLHRLITIRLSQYPSTIMDDINKLTTRTLNAREQWSILVNLGEKQSLEVVQKIVLDGMNKKKQYLLQPRKQQ